MLGSRLWKVQQTKKLQDETKFEAGLNARLCASRVFFVSLVLRGSSLSFFSVQRRMASARSFNMFPSMLHMRLIN